MHEIQINFAHGNEIQRYPHFMECDHSDRRADAHRQTFLTVGALPKRRTDTVPVSRSPERVQ